MLMLGMATFAGRRGAVPLAAIREASVKHRNRQRTKAPMPPDKAQRLTAGRRHTDTTRKETPGASCCIPIRCRQELEER
jgi:hypothetical protein